MLLRCSEGGTQHVPAWQVNTHGFITQDVQASLSGSVYVCRLATVDASYHYHLSWPLVEHDIKIVRLAINAWLPGGGLLRPRVELLEAL